MLTFLTISLAVMAFNVRGSRLLSTTLELAQELSY